MPLTNAGRDYLAQAAINDSPTFFDNANARIAVGDSNAAFAVGQIDLQAVANKIRKGMEASYPQRAANVLTFRSVYADSEANFVWNEWGVFNDAAAGVMLNRKVENLGTKTSAAVWQLTVTLTVTIGS
ncbi:MAG: hypothetical protein GEU95_01240 [Rhizobiales bacterium]|nr:hypothetical protein [Hyphomicrobiales bacterium]